MNEQFPSAFGGSSAPQPTPEVDVVQDREPRDPRAVRSLIAGAAAVAVLGGGTLGFLWLSSTPGGNGAEASVPGAVATPSVSVPGVEQTPVSFAASGRDIFAGTVAPSTVVDSGGTATSASSSGSGATPASVPTAAPRATGSATPTRVTVPSTGTTVPAPPPPVATPSDTRSTAPGWTTPQVAFLTGDDAAGIFLIAGEQVTIAKGQLVYPLGIRYQGLVGAGTSSPTTSATATSGSSVPSVRALFTTENSTATGWVLKSDPSGKVLIPNAVVGTPQGRAKVYGVLDGRRWWIRVDDQTTGVPYEVNDIVKGTGLTFLGVENDELGTKGVYFKDNLENTYFGTFGGGESDGVAF